MNLNLRIADQPVGPVTGTELLSVTVGGKLTRTLRILLPELFTNIYKKKQNNRITEYQ